MLVILRFASNGGFYVANQTLCGRHISESPRLMQILGLETNSLRKIHISGTNMKIPHLSKHKPKTAVVDSAVVENQVSGGPL